MKNDYGLIKPFGPSIFKAKIPEDLINNLNKFIDNIIDNKEQSKKLDVGKGLVGDDFFVSMYLELNLSPFCVYLIFCRPMT